MVEPLSILGAVSASIRLLSLARQGVERIAEDVRKYQDYGRTLAKFRHDVETLQLRLELWEKEWEIGNTEQGGEGIRHFGAEGWEEVRRERDLIADLSLSLVGLLSPLMLLVPPLGLKLIGLSNSGGQQPVSKRNKLQKRGGPPRTVEAGRDFMQSQSYQTLRALIEHQQYAKLLDQRYEYLQKVKETLGSRQDQIAGKIQELRERYFQLKSISDSNFEEMHIIIIGKYAYTAAPGSCTEDLGFEICSFLPSSCNPLNPISFDAEPRSCRSIRRWPRTRHATRSEIKY